MPAPLLGMLGRGALEVLKYAGVAGIPGIGFGLLAQPKEYEENFDYDFYNKDNPRFYSPIYATEDNPLGFNQEMYENAMDEYHRIKPLY